ncbi:hypothetical protein GJAV_G00044980 [Gymnothorax javanicus]|nr:hypothetical protein GJAV_G00044980 [Gymnothorax javanicus]
MRSAAFILLACLLLVEVKGRVISPRGRCLCLDTGVNFIKPKTIEKIEVLYPSASCQNLEIIATLKGNGEIMCLNPESRFAKNFIKDAQKKKGKQE